ncbi:MAG: hypothetical protein ACRENE_32180 [Polyangiaceae bacterium]
MSKVIVERPRLGRSHRATSEYPRGYLENRWAPDWDAAPRVEGMGRGYREKSFNENLRPLLRFLHSNTGRLWDDVYSEIAARVSCQSAVQKHVLTHLREYVAETAWPEGETVMAPRLGGHIEPLVSVGMRFRFYVCPRTRRLLLAPPRRRKRKYARNPDDRVVLSAERELRRVEGIWYEIDVARIPTGSACFDIVERAVPGSIASRPGTISPLWRSGRYARSKRQLNSRELARYRLSNLQT